MSSLAVIVAAAASSALTSAWHLHLERAARARARLAACRHELGPVEEVAPHPLGLGPRFYQRACLHRCGYAENVNDDGSPYVPVAARRRDK